MSADRSGDKILSFSEIKSIVNENRLELLGRSTEQQNHYLHFIQEVIPISWVSTADYLLATKFELDVEFVESNKKRVKRPFSCGNNVIIKLTKNDYPYHFENDVDHFILWKLNGILSIEEIMEAIQTIKQTSNIDDAIYYINPINLKSIPEIEHAHIITKRSN